MGRRCASALLALIVLAAPVIGDNFSSPAWKDEISHGYLPYHRLTYDDFPIANGVPTPHLMHTQGFLHYSFQASWKSDGDSATAHITEMSIRSGFDQNRSWQQSGITETKALLAHEQGHLDINELYANQFRENPLPTGTASTGPEAMEDLKQKVEAISQRCEEGSKQEQARYDEDTNHGANQDEQNRWNQDLAKRLAAAHITR
ncbi:MAG TPA: DUF922 domain-containing protein [Fimbriimonadaceae bacterium]|nr:DUF922 domain-containing protein [Fimbriimonadaceae bacterium]